MRTSESLTEREAEVLALVSQGLTRREIARLLGIRSGTVKAHVLRACQKFGIEGGNLVALVRAWERSKEESA